MGKKKSGGKIEVLVERVLDAHRVLAHVRASKAPKVDSELIFNEGIVAVCEGRQEDLFLLNFQIDHDIFNLLDHIGHIPLPPYIARTDENNDNQRYQTVYAQHNGAVAAPTAGLHFTESILSALKSKGVILAEITLHVGAGTFQPVRVQDIREHIMHQEWYNVPQNTVNAIHSAHQAGKKVCAIGTTSVRALESASATGSLIAGHGDTRIFITPGYHFRVVDQLLTNFHLPKSTLMMLVSAFAGMDTIQQAYQHAIEQEYRFFSYGDAMLLYRQDNK